MQHVVIDQADCTLSIERERLVVRHAQRSKPLSVPLQAMRSLTLSARMLVDTQLLCQLAGRAIRVQVLPVRSHRVGSCQVVGAPHRDVARRLQQYQWQQQPGQAAQLALRVVLLRLRSQRQLLHGLARQRPDRSYVLLRMAEQIDAVLAELWTRRLALQADPAPGFGMDWLRGMEGRGSACFFLGFQQVFAPALGFNQRNRRPPRDPVNVILSLGYTLLAGVVSHALRRAGLDVQLGFLHALSYGRDSLVCDLMELQRAEVERLAWRLFAEQLLRPEHFSVLREGAACQLGKAGRAIFYAQWARLQPALVMQAEANAWTLLRRMHADVELEAPESEEKEEQDAEVEGRDGPSADSDPVA